MCCLCYSGGRGAANVGGMSVGRGGMAGVRGMGSGHTGGSRGTGFPQSESATKTTVHNQPSDAVPSTSYCTLDTDELEQENDDDDGVYS